MKITKYLCLAFSFLLFSCDKVETGGTDNVNEDAISFTASITAVNNGATRLTTNNSWAGLTDNSIAVKIGDVVKKYTVSATGEMTSDAPFFWNDISAQDATVSAWYPYNEGVKPEVVVCADQSIAENFQKSDFLECETTISKESSVLTFTHAGAKIICEVILDEEVDASLNASKVMLSGFTSIADGEIITTNGAREALVAPQSVAANQVKVMIELSDGRYTEGDPNPIVREGTIEYPFKIEKGYYYTFKATVKASEMTVVCTGSSAWTGDSSNVDAETPEVGTGAEGDSWEQNEEDANVNGETSTVSPGNGNDSEWTGSTENVEAGTKDNQSDSESTEE